MEHHICYRWQLAALLNIHDHHFFFTSLAQLPHCSHSMHDKSTVRSRKVLPLSLAWALLIYKSQGLTLLQAVLDLVDHEVSAVALF